MVFIQLSSLFANHGLFSIYGEHLPTIGGPMLTSLQTAKTLPQTQEEKTSLQLLPAVLDAKVDDTDKASNNLPLIFVILKRLMGRLLAAPAIIDQANNEHLLKSELTSIVPRR